NILETSVGVGIRDNSEQAFHFLVPDARKVGKIHRTGEKFSLDFIAEDNVKDVGHFIGIHTDERGFDMVDRLNEAVEIYSIELFWERFFQIWKDQFPKWSPLTDKAFPPSGLTFVNAERAGFGEGSSQFFMRKAELIKGVSSFV